jgi:hypothetical protein
MWFSDRHFWHRDYDKAKADASVCGAPEQTLTPLPYSQFTNVPTGQLRVFRSPVFCQLSLLFSEAIPKRVVPPVNRRPAPFGLWPPVLPVPPCG